MKLPEKIFEHGAVQAALVAKVVVKHGLIRVRRRGNLLGARPGHSLGGKMPLGGGQNAAAPSPDFRLFCVRVACVVSQTPGRVLNPRPVVGKREGAFPRQRYSTSFFLELFN